VIKERIADLAGHRHLRELSADRDRIDEVGRLSRWRDPSSTT